MTNANNIDTNVNAKSPKLTCCELLWLRVRNGKMERKKLSLFIRTDLSLSIKINANLTGQKRCPLLHFSCQNLYFTFPRMRHSFGSIA